MVGLGDVGFYSKSIFHHQIVWEPVEKIQRWCRLPYVAHSNGCPNADDCKFFDHELKDVLAVNRPLSIAWVEFNIDDYEERMRVKHPTWTQRQCRNLLYWQTSLRKHLVERCREKYNGSKIILGAEGGGVNFHRTMRALGVKLDLPRDLHTIRVIAIVVGRGPTQMRLETS